MSATDEHRVIPAAEIEARAITILWARDSANVAAPIAGLPAAWTVIPCTPAFVAQLSNTSGAHVIVYDTGSARRVDLTSLRTTARRFAAATILVVDEVSQELLLWALRERVWDVLVGPVDAVSLMDAVQRFFADRRTSAQCAFGAAALTGGTSAAGVSAPRRATAQAVAYVEQHYEGPISASEAARRCGLSLSHFSRTFVREHGLPFSEFVLRHRIALARRLLAQPNQLVTKIAYCVGFTDHSYFSRVFKRFTGLSPSAFHAQALAPQSSTRAG